MLKKVSSLAPPVIWVWGHSRDGHLGMGDKINILEPCELESLSTKNIIQISAGEHHCCALSDESEVFIWGACPVSGVLTEEPTKDIIQTPTPVCGLEAKSVIRVICGNRCSYALTDTGNVYSWGIGRYGVLGHGNTENYEFPGMITAFNGKTIVGIDSGGNHACAWTSDGRVYSWGSGRGNYSSFF